MQWLKCQSFKYYYCIWHFHMMTNRDKGWTLSTSISLPVHKYKEGMKEAVLIGHNISSVQLTVVAQLSCKFARAFCGNSISTAEHVWYVHFSPLMPWWPLLSSGKALPNFKFLLNYIVMQTKGHYLTWLPPPSFKRPLTCHVLCWHTTAANVQLSSSPFFHVRTSLQCTFTLCT